VTVAGYSSYNTLDLVTKHWSFLEVLWPDYFQSGRFNHLFFNPPAKLLEVYAETLYLDLTNPAPIMVVPQWLRFVRIQFNLLMEVQERQVQFQYLLKILMRQQTVWTVAIFCWWNTAASQWTLRPNSYNYINGFGWNVVFHSNDNSQFFLANSDLKVHHLE
jgi:hypothetical protein